MDNTKIDNVELDDVDTKDYPDFCDAFIVSADYNGIAMTEEELNEINEDRDFVYEKVLEHLY